MKTHSLEGARYAHAMGNLLVLYTQVDQFIMEACAERIATAPDQAAKMGLAKQVGDECRHVSIQKTWMQQFGVDQTPLIEQQAIERLHAHFRALDWTDFLTDLYLVVEALGSQAVEQVVPLADPGTRESLRVPLQDELDHVAFGLSELHKALNRMDAAHRQARLDGIPARIQAVFAMLEELDVPVLDWFEQVGASSTQLHDALGQRREELLAGLAIAA
ncbi:MAG: ferritin-like fold-containing protein [Thiogranum sp.]